MQMQDDPEPPPEAKPSEDEKKETKVKRTASKVRAGKKRTATGKTAASRKNGTRSRLDENAKVVKTGKENGFREGTDSWKRTEAVLKSSGQTVAAIRSKHGKLLKPGTLTNLRNLGYIKIG